MNLSPRWIRELVIFLLFMAAALIVLPVILAALAYQSRQAMFWPTYQALYTYFLGYTVLAAVVLAAFSEMIRLLVLRLRWR